MVEKIETDQKPQDAPPVGAVPEDANQRELWLLQFLFASFGLFAYWCYAYNWCGWTWLFTRDIRFFCIVGFTDCPGTEAEEAGKASACDGCPNQQICATAPKGPDPGINLFNFIQY